MIMTSFQQRLARFRQWQKDSSLHIAKPSDEPFHCQCCGTDFRGNFCPRCGQESGVGRITWKTVQKGFAMLWGMDSRSLPYTLCQLLLRPGYLIRDYISGKQQASYPPISLLVCVAVVVFIFVSIKSPQDISGNSSGHLLIFAPAGENFLMFDNVFNFFEQHYDVGVTFFLSLLVIPTYFIFRLSPQCDHHTLPESLFILVFNSTITLLWVLIFWFFIAVFKLEPKSATPFILLSIVVLTVYRSYHRLFGYGRWSTLWRVIAVFFAAVLTMCLLVLSDHMTYLVISGKSIIALKIFACRFIPFLLGIIFVIGASYYISRRTQVKAA